MRDHAGMGSVDTRALVGRKADLATLTELACAGEIVYVHGLAGVGKSALLESFSQRCRAGGGSVVALDCRAVEPTERGFLRAAGFDDVDAFHEHLRRLAPPVVLILDHCEVYRLMDTWLRRTLVPSLPAGVGLVLACRERPVAGWLGIEAFHVLALGPLGGSDARACCLRVAAWRPPRWPG
jgi:hypothetical protein